MAKETTQLYIALLKEWFDEIRHQYMDEHTTGISFIYHELKVDLVIDSESAALYIYMTRRDSDDVIKYQGNAKLSEFDLCNPNTTPSERFHPLKSYLDMVLNMREN